LEKRFNELKKLNNQLDKTVQKINFADFDSLKMKTITQDIQTDCNYANLGSWFKNEMKYCSVEMQTEDSSNVINSIRSNIIKNVMNKNGSTTSPQINKDKIWDKLDFINLSLEKKSGSYRKALRDDDHKEEIMSYISQHKGE